MMYGLSATPAGTASLLLNLEVVATALIATFLFHEALGRRVGAAVGLIAVAAGLLTWRAGAAWGISLGALGVVAACVLWGLDNNLTRLVAGSDGMRIVFVKGWSAGAFSLGLAALLSARAPSAREALLGIALGGVSYGASIALFVRALRTLGAARTGGLFGTAPFIGAVLSWLLGLEAPTATVLLSFPLMASGAYLLMTESHGHTHHHSELEHEHSHTHDDGHHDHDHDGIAVVPGVPHTHRHRHAAVTHDHRHTPDTHHRHRH
jgi:drug/metabolite transporter (DMT)-like permease